eukprot:m.342077 g.342077  ORF g.342077 m.342077 type:complete len:348 (-) comp20875_c0_seq1:128-1171(-)
MVSNTGLRRFVATFLCFLFTQQAVAWEKQLYQKNKPSAHTGGDCNLHSDCKYGEICITNPTTCNPLDSLATGGADDRCAPLSNELFLIAELSACQSGDGLTCNDSDFTFRDEIGRPCKSYTKDLCEEETSILARDICCVCGGGSSVNADALERVVTPTPIFRPLPPEAEPTESHDTTQTEGALHRVEVDVGKKKKIKKKNSKKNKEAKKELWDEQGHEIEVITMRQTRSEDGKKGSKVVHPVNRDSERDLPRKAKSKASEFSHSELLEEASETTEMNRIIKLKITLLYMIGGLSLGLSFSFVIYSLVFKNDEPEISELLRMEIEDEILEGEKISLIDQDFNTIRYYS